VICFELQCSEELQTAHTTIFPYTIDGVPFWMRYYMIPLVQLSEVARAEAVRCACALFNEMHSKYMHQASRFDPLPMTAAS